MLGAGNETNRVAASALLLAFTARLLHKVQFRVLLERGRSTAFAFTRWVEQFVPAATHITHQLCTETALDLEKMLSFQPRLRDFQ